MSLMQRPSRSGPTRNWLDYLDALRGALAAASAHDALALRFEVTIAENELMRRGLPPRALELPDRRPDPPETFSPRPWASPEAQRLWGEALVKVGRKYRDERSIRLGWAELRAARAQNRGEPEGPGEEGMKLPDDRPHAPTPLQRMLSVPIDATPCCHVEGRALMVAGEEPLCLTIGAESEVYRFIWRSSFDGDAVVRIGRQGDAITLRWRYDWYRAPAPDDAPTEAALSLTDWARLQDALIAASFWALDPVDEQRGLDGANWLIEGRRRSISRGVSRWSPQGQFQGLGRVFFALAGPPLAEVRLY
jgi:hypothetical protein